MPPVYRILGKEKVQQLLTFILDSYMGKRKEWHIKAWRY